MAAYDFAQGAKQAAEAVSDYRSGTNTHWNDSYLNMGAQLMTADMANAHELEMWNLQNAYNTPAAQMKRMKEAGLNPMLFYSQGNPGNASSAPGTHAPNFQLHPQADTMSKIQTALQVFQTFNQMLGQAFGVTEQAYDIGMKRNELAFSNFDIAGARQFFSDFGSRDVSAHRFARGFNFATAMDPSSPGYNPVLANFLGKIGAAQYYPRVTTAEANAYLSGKRAEYQQWYNESFAPLLEKYKSGQIGIQELQHNMLDYQDQMLNMLPPEFRAIIAPLFDYIRPFINSLLRR